MRRLRPVLWLMLAVPALLMLVRLADGETWPMELLPPSGEVALLLMIAALLPGPLADAFGRTRLLRGWLAIRRNLGVAAFSYALLHLVFYALDVGSLGAMAGEIGLPGIWTGWIAFLLMLAAAWISTDRLQRRLGRRWKTVQRGAYPALVLILVHWALLDRTWGPALIHLAPLGIAWSLRAARLRRMIFVKGPA